MKMKKCFINIFDGKAFGIPMVTTRTGWNRLVGPAVMIGQIDSTTDKEIGTLTHRTLDLFASDIPDEYPKNEQLDKSFQNYGYRSYRSFFRKCLQMSVEEVNQRYRLTPYARATEKGIEGATPLETAFYSSGEAAELGRAVRECIALCR